MRIFSRILLVSLISFFVVSCNEDSNDDQAKPELIINTITSGNIPSSGNYGVTFSGLSGEDIPSEIGSFAIGYNADTVVQFNRLGEALTVKLFNIPQECIQKGETAYQDTLRIGIITGTSREVTFELECN